MTKPYVPTEKLRPLCTEVTCDRVATGLYPVHAANDAGPGGETPSADEAWDWALLCNDCAPPVMEQNPSPAPAVVHLAE